MFYHYYIFLFYIIYNSNPSLHFRPRGWKYVFDSKNICFSVIIILSPHCYTRILIVYSLVNDVSKTIFYVLQYVYWHFEEFVRYVKIISFSLLFVSFASLHINNVIVITKCSFYVNLFNLFKTIKLQYMIYAGT